MNLTAADFIRRRENLMKEVATGSILLTSNQLLPRNYAGNPFPFRQDSTFFYYTGITVPDVCLYLDCENGKSSLSGKNPTIEDTIWSGHQITLEALAEKSGIPNILSPEQLKEVIDLNNKQKLLLHLLPPYSDSKLLKLSYLTGFPPSEIKSRISLLLRKSIIKQRSVKSADEILEIETALNISGKMHKKAMEMAVEGVFEYEIVAEMYRIAKLNDLEFAYQVICSVHGEILHNESHHNKLEKGQLLLVDAGVESSNYYASDITRTTPVGGKFTRQQREIYDIVLAAQEESIRLIKPGIRYADIHMNAAGIIATGLKDLGLMKGNIESAVMAGAHAMFFPHGLGHMMGLDVHDMEDLGEDLVGYDESVSRSDQFGKAYLRLARKLEPGFVLTVEPGIYFIPELIKQWHSQNKMAEFINYDRVNDYLTFGGIRIEDNIVVTSSGSRILGEPIIKTTQEIEDHSGKF